MFLIRRMIVDYDAHFLGRHLMEYFFLTLSASLYYTMILQRITGSVWDMPDSNPGPFPHICSCSGGPGQCWRSSSWT